MSEPRIRFDASTTIPTIHGEFEVRAYTDTTTSDVHLAICSGELRDDAIVRLHSECFTGEALGSLKCECGPQLRAALDAIGQAVLVLPRQRDVERTPGPRPCRRRQIEALGEGRPLRERSHHERQHVRLVVLVLRPRREHSRCSQ